MYVRTVHIKPEYYITMCTYSKYCGGVYIEKLKCCVPKNEQHSRTTIWLCEQD